MIDSVPTEIRPAGVTKAPRPKPVKKAKKVAPILVQGLDPALFNFLVICSAELSTQPGIMRCMLPNCEAKTRCRLSTTGMPICAGCSRRIQTGFAGPGRWIPVKRTTKATSVTANHIRLLGGPLDMTNVRCASGKGAKTVRWKNGFIIDGTHAELYVYDSAVSCYRWWDRT